MTEQTPQNILEQIANAAVAQAAQIPVEQVQAAMNDAQMPQNVPQGAQTTQPTQQTPAQPIAPQMGATALQQVQYAPVQTSSSAQTFPAQPAQSATPAQAPDIQQIIDQQNAQIAALMAQNRHLNAQVVQMVQSGAQITQQQAQAQPIVEPAQPQYPTQAQQMAQLGAQPDPLTTFNPPALSNNADYSLEGLAGQIGKYDERE